MNDWRVTPIDQVSVTYEWAGWEVECSWPQRVRRHDIITLIRVSNQGKLVQPTMRLNIFSGSAVNSLARQMRSVLGEDTHGPITGFVHNLVEDLYSWYKLDGRTEYPEPVMREGGQWLVYPLWPTVGITGVSAAPSAFKSLLAQGIALSLVTGTQVLDTTTQIPEKVEKVLYLDWEGDADTFSERLYGLCEGAGLEKKPWLAYKKMRIPLADAAMGLAEEIGRTETKAVIVDSMSASIGGSLKEDDTVNAFYDAIRQFGVPTLVLAHKSAENIRQRNKRFFGSMMSEARLRMAWNAERAEDGPSVVWEVSKDNISGLEGAKRAWNVLVKSDGAEHHRRMREIIVNGVEPHDVRLKASDSDTLADRVESVLAGGPMRVVEIAQAVDGPEASVRTTLNRNQSVFRKAEHGQWELNTLPDPL